MNVASLGIAIFLLLHQSASGQLPQFQMPEDVRINQNPRVGYLLTTLSCTFSEAISYRLPTQEVNFVEVNSTTGELRLTVNASSILPGSYPVQLECFYLSRISQATLNIVRLEDQNEFPPVFSGEDVRVVHPEDTALSSLILQVMATDRDVGHFGEVTYAITTGGGISSIFAIDSSSGRITLASTLDFETTPRYQFFVEASNAASGPGTLSDSILVMVEVTDIDDTSPVFDLFNQSRYFLSLPENYTEPANILDVRCTDLDSRDEDISYGITGGSHSPFQLNSVTGELLLGPEGLDYETTIFYSFSIACFDNSQANNSGSASVDISVLPVNEGHPVVTQSVTIFPLSLRETDPPGRVIVSTRDTAAAGYMYAARDGDSGPDGNITYTLNSDDEILAEFFSIDINTGEVINNRQLDFDTNTSLTQTSSLSGFVLEPFRITVCDIFPPPLDSACPNMLVNMLITAVNEFAPEFSQEEYDFSVPEDRQFGSSVAQVSCTDRDMVVGSFSNITFVNASQSVQDNFVMDPETGEIRMTGTLDYEAVTNFGFHIRCRDSMGLEDQALVTIEILPVNDNRPEFTEGNYRFDVSRTTPANRFPVGQVTATDADVGLGGDLRYSVEPNPFFDIASDGVVLLINSIQNESAPGIQFNAFVTDGVQNSTSFRDNAFVIITFTDGNLNRPLFELGLGSRTVEISELLPVGREVTTIQCRDDEEGLNGAVVYSIESGNTDNTFSIDRETGVVSVSALLTLPRNVSSEEYPLTVVCQDLGVPILSSRATVFVRILQDDSSPPSISSDTLFVFVDEDASLNTQIISINATDLDTDLLEFRLENESHPGVFIIDPPTGIVLLAGALNREVVAVYTMAVVVTERRVITGPERSDSALLTVLVRDINDNSPTCNQMLLQATVPDTIIEGDPLLTLNCSDLDVGDNGNLTYSLLGDGFGGVLAIDGFTGTIFLNGSLSQVDGNIFVLEVLVSDRGSPTALSNSYHVTIRISSTNRNVPSFVNLPNEISIPESLPVQETVFAVMAQDPDRGSFGQLTYRIASSTDDSKFEIIPNTGTILLRSSLDFFEQTTYSLNISVEDSNFTVLAPLVINVLDVNEFSPSCEETRITVSIPEGLVSNQNLSRLTCSDGDRGPNGELTYSIVSGNIGGVFSIDEHGSVVVSQELDFEQVQRYTLLITVSDGGTPPLGINVSMVVAVDAVNEFTPIFSRSFYEASVPENTAIGESVLGIATTDGDLATHQDGQVVYSLQGLDSTLFTISNTGLLQVAGDLDRERQEVISFTVHASDQGSPPRTAVASINVTLDDEDDNSPVFTENFYDAPLESRQNDSQASILTVTCTDQDAGPNAVVTYTLDPNSADSRFFLISPTDGTISVNSTALIVSRTYSFSVLCTGPPPARRSDSAVVIIRAIINSTITFHPSNIYNQTVDEDINPVYDVITISASSSNSAPLMFSLLPEVSAFRVDSTTGVLRLVGTLDYETEQSFVFRVQASDNGNPPNTAEAVVNVVVGNVNDETPAITTTPPVFNLTEGPTASTRNIFDFECHDNDRDSFGEVSFHIEQGNELGWFLISASGILSLVGDVDYEVTRSLSLEIVCQDGGNPALRDSITASISVLPVNEHPPLFQGEVIRLEVDESVPVNSHISDIMATDADSPPHNNIRYSITAGNTAPPTFSLASTTGQLTLVNSLDYETERMYTLTVLAEDSGGEADPDFPVLNDTVTVQINVRDVNDNTPTLSEQAYTGSIVEGNSVGAQVTLVNEISCSDSDSGANGDTFFSISGPFFEIHATSGIVTARQSLDFEVQSSYTLTVTCGDRGTPAMSSAANLFVTVTDVNEFSPRFANESGYTFSVNESIPIGGEVGQVVATDGDTGDAGIISYNFINSSEDTPFVINRESGVISLTRSLDFESLVHQYSLQTRASDNANNGNEVTVIINVINADDNLPLFSMDVYFMSIRENSPVDTLVGLVVCSDADNTALGIPVTYSMSSNAPFSIDALSGELRVTGEIDLEAVPRYILMITCTDTEGNTALANVSINVLPFNDFPPLFVESQYNTSVVENAAIGTLVQRVRATDDDITEYLTITYAIVSGNNAGLFSIDSASGILRVSSDAIDRENTSEHRLELEARNIIPPSDTSGSTSLASTATVLITVLDVNDNSPVLTPSDPPPVRILESDGPSAFVLQLHCSDTDNGANGTTLLAITSPGSNERFELSADGTLRTTTIIRSDESVTVTCFDAGTPVRSTSVQVSVNTISMNDHPPMFDRANYTVRVPEDTNIGEIVTCINATDRDGTDTPDGIFEYSLSFTGSGTSKFGIMADTGCVFVAIALNFDVTMQFEYTVHATDMGVVPLQGNATLTVEITDAVRDPPRFQSSSYTRVIPENVAVGSLISQVACSDPDINDTLTYRLVTSDDGQFVIDSRRGNISIAANLDFEVASSHTLQVSCVDSFGLEDRASVLVTVLPVNEFSPSFFSGSVDIEENSIVGREVTRLDWMDGDSGRDGEVNFSIQSGNIGNVFSVTRDGRVLVQGGLDRESIPSYTLNITISDQSLNDPRSSIGQLNVTLLDINDNRPHFLPQDTYMFGPLEGNETLDHSVGTLRCTDDDIGNNARTRFLISPENTNFTLFAVNAVSGMVRVSGNLRNRESDTVAFTVLCQDSGLPQLTGSARVLVRVEEINRYVPQFPVSSYSINVSEDTRVLEDVLLRVQAEDGDVGINGQIRYYLMDTFDGQYFIDETTGDISLLRPLDLEQRSSYVLVVIARDGALDSRVRLSSTVEVRVQVVGVNEHTPMCRNAIYTAIVNATSEGGVVNLLCSDADAGRDGELTYSITNGNEDGYFAAQDDSLVVPTPFYPSDGTERFTLQVTVSDLGEPSRNITVDAIVMYSFDNLDAPDFAQESYSIVVPEVTEIGTVVTTLTATDSDPSLQGQIRYSVLDSANFRIDAVSGDLFVATPLDYETHPFLTFHVIAEDSDPLMPMLGMATVNVSIVNNNDNPPQCDRLFYTTQVSSNASQGDLVLSLNCTDLDGNALRYSVISNTTTFRAELNTGRIFVAGQLTEPTYLVDIEVSGEDSERTVVFLSIATLFSNLEPPTFQQSEYVFHIAETAPLLSVVGTVRADDADSLTTDLTYTLLDPGMGEFFVNPTTGEVVLTVPLDFEVLDQYTFRVQVADGGSFDGSNVLSGTALVTVSVNNTNDLQPVLSNGGIYGHTVAEVTPVGTSVLTITCTDGDAAPFGAPSILGEGFEEAPFSLREVSAGQAEVNVSEELVGPNAYFLNVTCTDDTQVAEGQVFLFVPEPLAPIFSQPVYEWLVSENMGTGTEYTSIQATSNDQSDISYSIADGNSEGIFYIDPSSGVLSLVLTLDYETQRRHGLIVRAVDESNRESNVLLLIQVLDANDELPLVPPSALLGIRQNERPGFPVGTVECIDADSGINNTVFNYTFSPNSELFSIDAFGVIRLERELDNTPAYVLPVVCFDTRDSDINSTGIVTIEVEFVNLHQPVFQFPRYTFQVPEDLSALSLLGGPLHATDDDIGSFSELIYAIETEQDQFFIESGTGRMGLLTSLDREAQDLHELVVVAIDGGPSAVDRLRMTGSSTVLVTVEDANDNPPSPTQLSYVQSITTNHSVLSPVLSVSCSDPDLGSNGTVIYSLSPPSALNNFVIRSDGTILLAREQPRQAIHSFFAVCSDRGSPVLNSTALVTVTVDFVAVSAPVFNQSHYNASLLESSPVATPVVQVQAIPQDSSVSVVYDLVEGNDGESFFVNPVTGEVSVRNLLDAREQQQFTLTVRAGNAGSDQLFSLATVSIFVEDINDNSPVFESQFYTGTVSERATPLTPVVQVVCTDSDVRSQISYAITGGLSSPAEFNITQGGQVVVARQLDYESATGYSLEVTCRDGSGLEARATLTTVRINVSPVNEFLPRFNRTSYNFQATENDFGALIGRVEATDGDDGVHGMVTYLLQDPGNFSVIFVDPASGDVLVSTNLDYETQTLWNLTVIARDGEGLETSVSLDIQVLNVNDVSPALEPATSVQTVPVDAEPNAPIQAYTCIDADGSETTTSIVGGNSEGYFQLSGNNVILWTGLASNLTSNFITSLTLRCHDNQAPDQFDESIIAVSIVVTDAVPPMFSQTLYSTSITENTTTNTSVLRVSAVGEHPMVAYALLSLPSGFPFAIDPVSGWISLVGTLDREATAQYSFYTAATDPVTGAIGLSQVMILITDINDNSPVITPRSQSVQLPENATFTSIAAFMCTDIDAGSNSVLSFQITSGNTLNAFTVDDNGLVSLIQPLDFESLTNHTLEITCRDGADTSPLSDSATLLISVQGVNEHTPEFTNSTYFFSVRESAPTGFVVGTVSASNLDAGRDGEITFSVLPSSNGMDQFFTLDSRGVIATSFLPLNATLMPTIRFTIRASDGELNNDAAVIVTVEDQNEPPLFSSPGNYFVRTAVDFPRGSSLLQFTCYDTDVLGDNSAVDVELTEIPASLDLYLRTVERSSARDAEVISNSTLLAGSYELNVTCTDRGSPSMASTTSVTLRVDPLNSPPVFVGSPVLAFAVDEDIIPGTPIFYTNASDAESSVLYSITGGTGLGTFVIDNMTGLVSSFLPLDHEVTSSYELEITATDTEQLSASTVAYLSVINVNDLAPMLSPQATLVVSLEEDADPDRTPPIESYVCSDPDGSQTMLSIMSQDANLPFGISSSGDVFLRTAVDYEVSISHTINVTCRDMEVRTGEGTSLISSTLLIVHIRPINIFSPNFTSPLFFEVAEGAPIGQVVGTLTARDDDNRGVVTFSSSSHTTVFHVSPTGNITLLAALDYEMLREYRLMIEASDNDDEQDVEPRSTSADIVVRVTDVNDNTPTCSPGVLSTNFRTGDYVGEDSVTLAQLNCSDIDDGVNRLLSYSFIDDTLPVTPGGRFILNSTTGQFKFQGSIEVSGSRVIEALVRDSGTPTRSATVSIVVQIESTDDTRPRFNQSVFIVSISEEEFSPSTILSGQVIRENFINPLGERVVFGLQANASNEGAFVIDRASADVILTDSKLIDYDEGRREYTLRVEARVNSSVEIALIEVTVTDFNDNTPQFPRSIYNGSALENQPPGTFILRVEANDIDSAENALIQYSLLDGHLSFSINSESGNITTSRMLDREAVDRYTIVVLATDAGLPPRTGSATVTISVDDVNDQAPSFVDSIYVVSVNNTIEPGEVIVTLRADDQDEVGTLSFQIDDAEARTLFLVDSDGVVRLRSSGLPQGHRSRYDFTVEVSDGRLADRATVVVYIVSVTTDTVIFEENEIGEEYDIRDFLSHSFNISLAAAYTIVKGDLFDQFEVVPNGRLILNQALDRENTSSYGLTLLVIDNVTSVNVELLVNVTVHDQNDNSPEFSSDVYMFNVSEGLYEDAVALGTVMATDLDQPGTGASTIRYELVFSDGSFAVDPLTGELFVKAGTRLDREKSQNTTILVLARDFGEPSALTSNVLVMIMLEDINDNDPEFVPLAVLSYIVFLPSDKIQSGTRLDKITVVFPRGVTSEVETIAVTDPDPSSTVTATLEGNVEQLKFGFLDPQSSELVLVTTEEVTKADFGTSLHIVLRDQPILEEDSPVVRNISFVGPGAVGPTSDGLNPENPGFFQTEAGIAIIVGICLLIVIVSISIICVLCYFRNRRETDPLKEGYRTTTIAQRLVNTETERRAKKKLGRQWHDYHTHSDVHQLQFPDLSPEDYEADRLYPPTSEKEASFMGGFLPAGDSDDEPFIPRPRDEFGDPVDYFNEEEMSMLNTPLMNSHADPFGFQETDTSVISSLHTPPGGDPNDSLNSFGGSLNEYTMGPVLKAMLDEWNMGDELLAKRKRKRKTSSHEQLN